MFVKSQFEIADRQRVLKFKEYQKNGYLKSLHCSITGEIMKDPVIDCHGCTYDRSLVSKCIVVSSTSNEPVFKCPYYQEILTVSSLYPNRVLEKVAQELYAEDGLENTISTVIHFQVTQAQEEAQQKYDQDMKKMKMKFKKIKKENEELIQKNSFLETKMQAQETRIQAQDIKLREQDNAIQEMGNTIKTMMEIIQQHSNDMKEMKEMKENFAIERLVTRSLAILGFLGTGFFAFRTK